MELFRNGLYHEFYEEFFNVLIPFQPPRRYGRSILENSSFLVSSVYADSRLHGTGFVARLSGATAEFLQMWLWMTVGRKPFVVNSHGELELQLAPVLSQHLFTSDRKFANPHRRSTYGPSRAVPRRIRLQPRIGAYVDFPGGTVPHPYATMVRAGEIKEIAVELRP